MKFVKKAEGKEVVPNSSFWFSIPGNIKVSRHQVKGENLQTNFLLDLLFQCTF